MNNITCKMFINNNDSPFIGNTINFYNHEDTSGYWVDMITFHIINDPNPVLRLECNTYDIQLKLYEYSINYIINNKIGKYKNMNISWYNDDVTNRDYIIIIYFDIININILLQLV